jgi:hypothetical protein
MGLRRSRCREDCERVVDEVGGAESRFVGFNGPR